MIMDFQGLVNFFYKFHKILAIPIHYLYSVNFIQKDYIFIKILKVSYFILITISHRIFVNNKWRYSLIILLGFIRYNTNWLN